MRPSLYSFTDDDLRNRTVSDLCTATGCHPSTITRARQARGIEPLHRERPGVKPAFIWSALDPALPIEENMRLTGCMTRDYVARKIRDLRKKGLTALDL